MIYNFNNLLLIKTKNHIKVTQHFLLHFIFSFHLFECRLLWVFIQSLYRFYEIVNLKLTKKTLRTYVLSG